MEKSKGRLIAFYTVFYPIAIANIVILVINIISFFARRDILTGSPVWHSSWINFIIELFALWILLSSCTQVYCIPNDKRLPVVFRFPGSNYASGSLRAWLMRQGYIYLIDGNLKPKLLKNSSNDILTRQKRGIDINLIAAVARGTGDALDITSITLLN